MSLASTDRSRAAWIDVGRGLAVSLVVLGHAIAFIGALGWHSPAWEAFGVALKVVRMPLLFLISGLLIERSLTRSWPVLRERKLAVWLWVYLVWSLINFCVFAIVPWRREDPPSDSWWDLLGILVWPNTGLWYLYALPLFLVLLRATRAWPAWLVVGLGLGLALLFDDDALLSTGNLPLDSMARNFVFFAVGARAGHLVRRFAELRTRPLLLLLVPLYTASVAVILLFVWGTGAGLRAIVSQPVMQVAISVLSVLAGVLVARLLAHRTAGQPLQQLGQRTLQVYVANEIVLGCLVTGVALVEAPPAGVVLLLPVLLTAAAIFVALTLHRVFRFVPGLYEPPSWVRSRAGGIERNRTPVTGARR